MKVEVVCKKNNLGELLQITPIDYTTSIKLAFDKIEQNQVLSSWKDAQTSDIFEKGFFFKRLTGIWSWALTTVDFCSYPYEWLNDKASSWSSF